MSVLFLDYSQEPRPTARPTRRRGGKKHRQSKAPRLPAGPRCSVLWGWTSATSSAMEPQGSHPLSEPQLAWAPLLQGGGESQGKAGGVHGSL